MRPEIDDDGLRIRTDSRPLYIRAEVALQDLVNRLELGPGERLPPEVELARLLGVSRSTIREALRNLELRGLVRRVQGLGTLIRGPSQPIIAGLERLESLEALAERQGWTCGTLDVQLRDDELSVEEAESLKRPPRSPAVRLARVKTRDGSRIARLVSIVPTDVLDRKTMERAFSTSIIDMFSATGGPVLDHALSDVRVEPSDPDTAAGLDVAIEVPLLLLEELFFDAEGQPFCLNRNWFLPGSLRLELIRRVAP